MDESTFLQVLTTEYGVSRPSPNLSHSGPVVRQEDRGPGPKAADHSIDRGIFPPVLPTLLRYSAIKKHIMSSFSYSPHNVFRLLSPTLLHS